jgi:hypothetical protein
MTTAKKISKSSKTNASHATNEGDETMKTTTKSHATNADHATHEGETTMKTTKTMHAESTTIPADIAATSSTAPVTTTLTTSPSTAATLAYIQTCTSLLDQLDAAFPQGDSLTAKDKKRQAKARKGSERYTPQLVALAKQHGVNLSLVPLDTISNASAEATALVPLQKRMEAMSGRASSRMFALQSTTWSGSTKLYSVLKRLSKDSGDIETGLAPVEQYFNHRHPSVAKEHPKTKKGKAALAAAKAAKAAAAATPESAPVAAPVETPVAAAVVAPAATPPTGATHS